MLLCCLGETGVFGRDNSSGGDTAAPRCVRSYLRGGEKLGEPWTLSGALRAALSLSTPWVFDAFPLQVITVHNTVRHKLQQKSIQV